MRLHAQLLILAGLLSVFPAATASVFDPGKLGFSIAFKGLTNPYREFAVYAMPGEKMSFRVLGVADTNVMRVNFQDRALTVSSKGEFTVAMPTKHGLYPMIVSHEASGERMRLNVFVLVPASAVHNGSYNGYRIGEYPARKLKGLAIYEHPRGYVEITEANAETRLSPHFTLSQFPSKQRTAYPKYLVLQERLLLKLEVILAELNKSGVRADSFQVMSGYRTPYYNARIGNVPYSRHLWGGAADIFVDVAPMDGVMDDLNRDGKVDLADAKWLYDFVENLYGESFYKPFRGGLGQYKATSAHGPFVHVDVRGYRARWGP